MSENSNVSGEGSTLPPVATVEPSFIEQLAEHLTKAIPLAVESEEQEKALLDCGCDYLQGMLVGAPADADSAAKEYV